LKLKTASWLILGAAVVLAGCAGHRRKSTTEPPAELVSFQATLNVKKLWSTKVGGGSERLRLGLKPASDGARIFAGAHDGRAAAYDAQTGHAVWSVKTDLALSAGPAYGDGMIAFGTSDGELLALDAQTGKELWREAVGSEVLAAPAIASGVIALRTSDGRLRGFSTKDGSTLWTVEEAMPTLTLRGNTAPRVAGSLVVCGFNNGRVAAYDVTSGEAQWEVAIANPTGRSELERLVDVSRGLQVVGSDAYAVGYHGRAVGVDMTTGVVLWQHDISSYAGLGADFSNVYVTSDVDAVVALDRAGGAPVWTQDKLRLRDLTAPTRFGNAVVVGDYQGYLHWLDSGDGHFVAREHAAGARITAAPLVVGDALYVQGDDGTVAAYTVPKPEPAA
jgi:outer membrane protein assembly factor BamB